MSPRAGFVRRLAAVGVVAVAPLVGGACEGDDAGPTPPTTPPSASAPDDVEPVEFGADVYVLVISRFLPEPVEPDVRPVVYVTPVSGDPLDLDTQVAVIDALADTHDVRFVDEPAAAVDDGDTADAPRDEGTLIGVGRISALPPHRVRVERYEDRDRVSANLLTLGPTADGWTVVTSEQVTPEVLGGDG
jgi:hypothetical protein